MRRPSWIPPASVALPLALWAIALYASMRFERHDALGTALVLVALAVALRLWRHWRSARRRGVGPAEVWERTRRRDLALPLTVDEAPRLVRRAALLNAVDLSVERTGDSLAVTSEDARSEVVVTATRVDGGTHVSFVAPSTRTLDGARGYELLTSLVEAVAKAVPGARPATPPPLVLPPEAQADEELRAAKGSRRGTDRG